MYKIASVCGAFVVFSWYYMLTGCIMLLICQRSL